MPSRIQAKLFAVSARPPRCCPAGLDGGTSIDVKDHRRDQPINDPKRDKRAACVRARRAPGRPAAAATAALPARGKTWAPDSLFSTARQAARCAKLPSRRCLSLSVAAQHSRYWKKVIAEAAAWAIPVPTPEPWITCRPRFRLPWRPPVRPLGRGERARHPTKRANWKSSCANHEGNVAQRRRAMKPHGRGFGRWKIRKGNENRSGAVPTVLIRLNQARRPSLSRRGPRQLERLIGSCQFDPHNAVRIAIGGRSADLRHCILPTGNLGARARALWER